MSDNKDIDINDKMEESSPKKVGRPPHLPNDDTRKQVYELSSVGTRYEDIATVLGISADTLTKCRARGRHTRWCGHCNKARLEGTGCE